MNREDAKQFIKDQEPIFLEPAKKQVSGRNTYICPDPACRNGSGQNGTGISFDKNSNRWHCFKCGLHEDVLGLIGIEYGLNNQADIFKKAYELYNIEIDENGTSHYVKKTAAPDKAVSETPISDYSEYFLKVSKNEDYSYLLSRGISADTQRRFNIGFDPAWISPAAVKKSSETGCKLPYPSERCIIPTSQYSYIARSTSKELNKYSKMKEGHVQPFNIQAIEHSDIIFITEGEIDALSIEEVGGCAIALGSTGMVKTFTQTVKENGVKNKVFILMLDNDERGKKASMELSESLKALKLSFISAYSFMHPKGKDPNESLNINRSEFKRSVTALKKEAQNKLIEISGNKGTYHAADLVDYFVGMEYTRPSFMASTGFQELDENLGGGLTESLIFIGALSSLGKTTFTLQIADQISKSGQDVLFFSLEQSKYELVSKSLSRLTYEIAGEDKNYSGYHISRTSSQILNSRNHLHYGKDEKQVYREAIRLYRENAEHLYIHEGRYNNQRLNVHHIREIVKNHIRRTGNRPVIFIDYLQIIAAPEEFRGTDKQLIDSVVFELKEISRDYKIPVIVISSFNRENYNSKASMTAFKESGSVEYSSDILIALEVNGLRESQTENDKKENRALIDTCKKSPVRKIDAVILKNRNGKTGGRIPFKYTAMFNNYEETLDAFPDNNGPLLEI